MRFLLDANMPLSSANCVRRGGHEAVDVRDIGLGSAEDRQIGAYAKLHRLAIITRDFDFSDVRNYPPHEFSGIVVLQLPDDTDAAGVNKTLDFFLRQSALIAELPHRLAIVASGRVRFRPPIP